MTLSDGPCREATPIAQAVRSLEITMCFHRPRPRAAALTTAGAAPLPLQVYNHDRLDGISRSQPLTASMSPRWSLPAPRTLIRADRRIRQVCWPLAVSDSRLGLTAGLALTRKSPATKKKCHVLASLGDCTGAGRSAILRTRYLHCKVSLAFGCAAARATSPVVVCQSSHTPDRTRPPERTCPKGKARVLCQG